MLQKVGKIWYKMLFIESKTLMWKAFFPKDGTVKTVFLVIIETNWFHVSLLKLVICRDF